MLAGLGCGVGLVLLLALLVWDRYNAAAAMDLGVDWRELLKTAAYVLAAAACSGGLGWAIWSFLRAHITQLARVEEEAAGVRVVLEASPDAILTVDTSGTIHTANPAAAQLFGIAPEAMERAKIATLIPQRNFLNDLVTLGRGTFSAFALRENQAQFPVEVAVSDVDTAQGRRFVLLIRDISDRRSSEQAAHHISLTASSTTGDDFVRTLLQNLSHSLLNDFTFVVETDRREKTGLCTLLLAEQGRLKSRTTHTLGDDTAFAEAMEKGYTSIPRGVRERFPEDGFLASLEAESFMAMPLAGNGGRVLGAIGLIRRKPMENLIMAKQTLQLFAARAAVEIERKQEAERLHSERQRLHGDYTLMQATVERERKRYEDDIAAEQELLAVTLRSIREGCITTDNDGRVIMINPTAEELTGWTEPEASERPLGDVVVLFHRRSGKPLDIGTALDHPEQFGAQMLLTARDGAERIVEASAAPIRDREERKLGTVLIIRDVTEKSRVDEERQKAEKLESLGLAAGGIAHDFNNLLTAIIGNLSLAHPLAPEGARERIEASRKAGLRAQDLAQQLLTFAKGGAPIKKTASMRQLVLDTVGFSLSGGNIRSSFALAEDLWPVDIDAGQISQVISNLAVNAGQAMVDGGTLYVSGENIVTTAADTPPTLRPGRYVRIIVRDEGPGIPEEIQKKIFDPYFTTKPKGSGLGLATSYSIVKNHDGLIQLTSVLGEGAAFIIYLPASEREVAAEAAPVAPRSSRRGRVLVLDDEEVICELVDCALTPLGYTVAQSYSAEEALRLYQEAMEGGKPFDVVIMDLTIPGGMGGKEAIKKLKELDPHARGIVSSGYAMDPIMSRFRDYGFCGVIAKPYDLDELQNVISEALATEKPLAGA